MAHQLELPVEFNEKELLFPLSIVPMGYTYRMVVTVNGQELTFERDEENQLRVLMRPDDMTNGKVVDPALLSAIMNSLNFLL